MTDDRALILKNVYSKISLIMDIEKICRERDNRIKDILFRILTKFRFKSLYVYFQTIREDIFRKTEITCTRGMMYDYLRELGFRFELLDNDEICIYSLK